LHINGSQVYFIYFPFRQNIGKWPYISLDTTQYYIFSVPNDAEVSIETLCRVWLVLWKKLLDNQKMRLYNKTLDNHYTHGNETLRNNYTMGDNYKMWDSLMMLDIF